MEEKQYHKYMQWIIRFFNKPSCNIRSGNSHRQVKLNIPKINKKTSPCSDLGVSKQFPPQWEFHQQWASTGIAEKSLVLPRSAKKFISPCKPVSLLLPMCTVRMESTVTQYFHQEWRHSLLKIWHLCNNHYSTCAGIEGSSSWTVTIWCCQNNAIASRPSCGMVFLFSKFWNGFCLFFPFYFSRPKQYWEVFWSAKMQKHVPGIQGLERFIEQPHLFLYLGETTVFYLRSNHRICSKHIEEGRRVLRRKHILLKHRFDENIQSSSVDTCMAEEEIWEIVRNYVFTEL